MPRLMKNAVQVVHFPGCPIYVVSGRRSVKKGKQELLVLLVVLALSLPAAKERLGSSIVIALEISCDRAALYLQATSNNRRAYPLKTGDYRHGLLSLCQSTTAEKVRETGKPADIRQLSF